MNLCFPIGSENSEDSGGSGDSCVSDGPCGSIASKSTDSSAGSDVQII